MKKLSALCIILVLVLALAACTVPDSGTGGTSTQPTKAAQKDKEPAKDKVAEGPKKISILAITFSGTPIEENEPAVLALEELTGYDVSLQFLLNSSYEDQLNTRMAAGNLPALVAITGKTPSVISYCRAGAFWDITVSSKIPCPVDTINPTID